MQRLLQLVAALLISITGMSQVSNPVDWSFTSRKTGDNEFEIHFTADIARGWHAYSPTTPKGGPEPIAFKFTKNPLVTMVGPLKELGKIEKRYEPLFKVEVKEVSGKMDFVQVVRIKGNAKTSLTGTVEYAPCNNDRCLPLRTKDFSIALNH